MLIKRNVSFKNALNNKTVLLTGAGGGIGFEAAKAFAYMGAKIIIAEIDTKKGSAAEKTINETFNVPLAAFYEIDLAKEDDINKMCDYILQKYGCLDVIFNNATITKMGAVDDVNIAFWDKSYCVNLKAPLLLVQRFLPTMKKRNSGTIVFVSSSGASPYMGAYEVFKTAQVELSNTLAMELEDTGIHTYAIGPGLVKTETAMNAIKIVAENMKMSIDEFYKMNSQHILDVESAGVGFALSVLHADTYHGQEIGAIQVLMEYNLAEEDDDSGENKVYEVVDNTRKEILTKVLQTFEEQYNGWRAMNVFERQWIFRDLKKSMGQSAEQVLEKLKTISDNFNTGNYQSIFCEKEFFEKLKEYWNHQLKLLQGYEKSKNKLQENSQIISGWISDIENLIV